MNGIWIRSQNNGFVHSRLKFCNDLTIAESGRKFAVAEDISTGASNILVVMGVYSTEARALEVLDEIQGRIDWGILNDGDKHCNPQVYQMPDE